VSKKQKESNTVKKEGQPTVSLSKLAYEKILEWLFSRKLTPGAFMSQGELSKLIDIPVQPLRDALRVLESENMLTIHPRSGIQFRKPDLEFIRATYQFRAIIENAAARSFAQYGSEDQMNTLIAQHNKLIEEIDNEGITSEVLSSIEQLEQQFHGAMIASLNNEFVEITSHKLKYYIRLIQLEQLFNPSLVKQSLREHITILEACLQRDEEAAVQALLVHFKEALHRHLKMF
jgi:DNA-binding GntR family transcriptional regulator